MGNIVHLKPAGKKPYQPPQLKVYGQFDALTRTVGSASKTADSGNNGTPHKTA
jgi:hypothetical protein